MAASGSDQGWPKSWGWQQSKVSKIDDTHGWTWPGIAALLDDDDTVDQSTVHWWAQPYRQP